MKTNASAEVIKITPEQATEWLAERWGEQRTVRIAHVNRLAADMEAGRFRVSPDAILRIKGKLANGQHRLTAVVQSGKAQSFLVMESNDEELYKVIDAGLRRNVADGLGGMHFAKTLPSIARWVMAYEAGTITQSSSQGLKQKSKRDHVATQCEIIDYCIGNQEILAEAAAFVTSLYTQTQLLPVSVGGALYVLAASREVLDQAKSFLQLVYLEGGRTSAGDLRNRLIQNRGSKAKLRPAYILGLTLKAFKSYLNGTRSGCLKLVEGEAFPAL